MIDAQKKMIAKGDRPEPIMMDGWFAQKFASGARREYGYPANGAPVAIVEKMTVVPGFFLRSHRSGQ